MICYELTQDARVQSLVEQGAEVLIASVAKTAAGMAGAHARLRALSRRHGLIVLAVNAVGPSDGVVCGGGSAGWDSQGCLLGTLDGESPGVLWAVARRGRSGELQ